MLGVDLIVDCACGLRYMRSTIYADTIENARAECVCGRTLDAWRGLQRVRFEAEDPSRPALILH